MSCCRSPHCWPRDRISGCSLFTAKLHLKELFDPSTLTTCKSNSLACCQETPCSAEPIYLLVPSVHSSQPSISGQEHWKSLGVRVESDCWQKLFFQHGILQYNHCWQKLSVSVVCKCLKPPGHRVLASQLLGSPPSFDVHEQKQD